MVLQKVQQQQQPPPKKTKWYFKNTFLPGKLFYPVLLLVLVVNIHGCWHPASQRCANSSHFRQFEDSDLANPLTKHRKVRCMTLAMPQFGMIFSVPPSEGCFPSVLKLLMFRRLADGMLHSAIHPNVIRFSGWFNHIQKPDLLMPELS